MVARSWWLRQVHKSGKQYRWLSAWADPQLANPDLLAHLLTLEPMHERKPEPPRTNGHTSMGGVVHSFRDYNNGQRGESLHRDLFLLAVMVRIVRGLLNVPRSYGAEWSSQQTIRSLGLML
jgi:hypothetical protein